MESGQIGARGRCVQFHVRTAPGRELANVSIQRLRTAVVIALEIKRSRKGVILESCALLMEIGDYGTIGRLAQSRVRMEQELDHGFVIIRYLCTTVVLVLDMTLTRKNAVPEPCVQLTDNGHSGTIGHLVQYLVKMVPGKGRAFVIIRHLRTMAFSVAEISTTRSIVLTGLFAQLMASGGSGLSGPCVPLHANVERS